MSLVQIVHDRVRYSARLSLLSPPVSHGAATQTRIVRLKGMAVGETRVIPPIEETDTQEGNCFDKALTDTIYFNLPEDCGLMALGDPVAISR
jgi:hypothetical protein